MTDHYLSEDDVDLGEVFKGVLTTAEFNHRNNRGAAEFHSMPYDRQVDHFNDHIVPLYQQHGLPIPGRGRWIDFQDSLKDMWRGDKQALVIRHQRLFEDTGRIFRVAKLANDVVRPHRPPCNFARAEHLKMAIQRSADAEQAKDTGGMVALYPRVADAQQLVVPGGEPLEDLHCTVIYLGQDVRDQDPTELIDFLHQLPQGGPIEATIFGSAIFNSSSEDACVVYLVGNTPHLTPLFQTLKQFVAARYPGAAEQHDPWLPHLTAAYGAGAALDYEGPVLFDRIGLRWPGADQDFPL